MRILFIHEVNYLTKPIFEMHEFPEYLAARGHDIYFLQFPEGASSAEQGNFRWRSKIVGRAVSGSEIELLTPKVWSAGILGRLFAAVTGSSIVRAAIRESSPDVIVTLAVPTFGWQAVQAAKRLGIPIVYRALDVSHMIRGGAFRPLVKMAEIFIAKRANFLSANNKAMAEYMGEMGAQQDRIEVHFPPMDITKYRGGNKLKGRQLIGVSESDHIVLYMGTFFYFSGLPEVVREFARLSPSPNAKLVLVGGGEQDRQLRALAKQLKLENQVLFTGFVGFEQLPDCLAAADVLINPMKKSLVSDTALPNKVIQYLAASKSVVSTNLRGITLTFDDYSGLHLVDSPEECIRRALDLALDRGPKDLGSNQQLLEGTFGSSSVKRFENFLERVVSSN